MPLTVERDVRTSVLPTQLAGLRLCLMWPVETSRPAVKVLLLLYFWFLVLTLAVSTVVLFLKAVKTSDLVDRSEAMDIFTFTASALYKVLYFLGNHHRFRELVLRMEQFPRGPLLGQSPLTLRSWMRWTYPLTKLHVTYGCTALFFWGCCPLLSYLAGVVSWEDMPLPMNVWYPFDTNHGILYLALYIVHHYGVVICAMIYLVCDSFLFSTIYFINGQLQFIKESLRSIDSIQGNGEQTAGEAKNAALNACIKHHAMLIRFARDLDLNFRSNILVDVLHAIISLSFAIFQASEARNPVAQAKMVSFVAICFWHQYLNSVFGQMLINQQESLQRTVYEMAWPGQSLAFQRSVLVVMGAGCLTPIKLSAWRMYFLQYETFLEFCRSMVSFFMVLRTMQEKGILK